VTISSMTAMRGMPGSVTTYAALSEGIRADLLRTPIKVTCRSAGSRDRAELDHSAARRFRFY
jgi:hypothetical protein